MFGLGPAELIIVLVLALIIFGPGKLPEVGKAVGRSIREFKSGFKEVEEAVTMAPMKERPTPPRGEGGSVAQVAQGSAGGPSSVANGSASGSSK